jgi:hypothetical protein
LEREERRNDLFRLSKGRSANEGRRQLGPTVGGLAQRGPLQGSGGGEGERSREREQGEASEGEGGRGVFLGSARIGRDGEDGKAVG